MHDNDVKLSKFLSYVLRHRPDEFGVSLDRSGWAEVSQVLGACRERGHPATFADLERVLAENDKQRFELDESRTKIRARQGHSAEVELGYAAAPPPEHLYHGTVARFLPSIREHGLHKAERHHVHLSESEAVARSVGERRGQPLVLVVEAGAMARSGHVFHRTENGVWLTEHVPAAFIRFGQ